VAPPSDSYLTIRKADLGSLFVFCEQSSSSSYRSKSLALLPSTKNRPEVEIGRKRRYVKEVASQFNRPSPVSYLYSVKIAHPAQSVWSYTQNRTRSENRRQMATPSRSNLTIRWVDLNMLLSKHSPSSICHLQVNSAFTNRENGPEAGISGRWRHLAEVLYHLIGRPRFANGVLQTFLVQLLPFSSYSRFLYNGPEAETSTRWRRLAEVT
jgi:hypothetical protein